MTDLNANKVDDMLEALNRAIEIHTKNAVQGLPYNKSELVEIVDITERNLGKYIVWNGSARYQAFSENTTYEMGTKVYVNIPNDDFKEQKHIIGPYVGDGESAVFYKNPLNDFLPLTGNLLDDKEFGEKKNGYDTTYGLVANYNKQGKTVSVEMDGEIQKVPAKDEVVEIYRAPDLNGSGYQGYKYLGISAEFKTLLNTFSPIAGDYGIVVTVWHAVKYDVQEDAAIEKRDYFLSVKDMIGNVYNFNTYFKQAVLYDISAFGDIQNVIVGFYQRGNFRMNNNREVPTHYTFNGESLLLSDNILVRNVSVSFGDDLMEGNDRAEIFSYNGSSYDPAQKDVLNYKNIKLRWTHLNSTSNNFEILDNTKASAQCGDYKIHWYEDAVHGMTDYIVTSKAKDAEADTQMKAYTEWKKIEDDFSNIDPDHVRSYTEAELQEARLKLINTFNLRKGNDYLISEGGVYNLTAYGEQIVESATSNIESEKIQRASIAGDVLAGSGWKPLGVAGQLFEWNNFLPNYKRSYSKVMAIIEYDEGDIKHKVKSNILQFDNLRITSNSLSDDKANALKIGFSDGTGGDYPIYNGTTGELLSREDVSRKRTFQATCRSLIDNRNYLNGNETIIWQIPKSGSMILMNQTFLTEPDSELFEDESKKNEEEQSDKYKEFQALFAQFAGTLDYDAKYYYIKRSVSNSKVPVNNEQAYQIAPYYNKANTNNTIYCYVIKNNDIFKGSASLTFGQHGTSGTDYTFTLGFIRKVDENWNVVDQGDTALTIGDPNYLEIEFELFNSKNEKIDLTPEQKNDIIKLWVNKENSSGDVSIDGFYSGLNLNEEGSIFGNAMNLRFIATKDEDGNYDRVAVKTNANNMNNLRYIVLQAAVTSKNVQSGEETLDAVKFIQLLPIHVRAAGTDWVLRGSDYIVYDDKGANPSCYNDYYQLFSPKNNIILKTGFRIDSSDFDPDPPSEKVLEEERKRSYYPKLIPLNKENNYWIDYKLQTIPLYINSISKEIVVQCGDDYICPLVILQNKYQIPAINSWNGELTIDNAGNKILASMMGAGHKNEDNTFTGVLMGDVIQKNSHTNQDEALTGLFGYLGGSQTFGFDTNGTAFIGKSDVGRIYIDGSSGRITSAAREQYDINISMGKEDNDPRGTDINLAENYIDIQGIGSNNKSRIHLDTLLRNNDGAYFSIDNNNGNRLIHIANNNYYLQTDNYIEQNLESNPSIQGSGLKIDLKNGVFNSYDKLSINGAKGSEIFFGDKKNYVKLGIDNSLNSYFEMQRVKPDKSLIKNYQDNLEEAFNKGSSLINNENLQKPTEINYKTNYELTNDSKNSLNTYINNYTNKLSEFTNNIEQQENSIKDFEDYRIFYNLEISTHNAFQQKVNEYENLKSIINADLNSLAQNKENAEKLWHGDQLEPPSAVVLENLAKQNYDNYKNGTLTYQDDEGYEINYQNALKAYEEEEQKKKSDYDYAVATRDYLTIQLNILTQELTLLQNEGASQAEIDAKNKEIEEVESLLDEVTEDRIQELKTLWENFRDENIDYFYNKHPEIDILTNFKKAKEYLANFEEKYNSAILNTSEKYLNFKEAKEIYEKACTNKEKAETEIGDVWAEIAYPTEDNPLDESQYGPLYKDWQEALNNLNEKKENLSEYLDNKPASEQEYNYMLDKYNELIEAYNNNLDILTNEQDKLQSLKNALNDYEDILNSFNSGQENSQAYILSINNTLDNRINVGNSFIVKSDGSIKATKGKIGNWEIGSNMLQGGNAKLYSSNQSDGVAINNSGLKKDWRIVVGTKFGVDNNGNLYAAAGRIGDAIITNDGHLKIEALYIEGTRYTPKKVNVVTSVSLNTDTGSASIPYSYETVTHTPKQVVSAISEWTAEEGHGVHGVPMIKLTPTYTTVTDTASTIQRGYVNFNYISEVSLTYKTTAMSVLAPAEESGATSAGSVRISA